MSNTEQIKHDDAIFNAALSVLGEWPATRECSMRARMTMAADMQDRIMDTVNAILTDRKRSAGGKLAADKRWKKAREKSAGAETATGERIAAEAAISAETVQVVRPVEGKKRGRPRKEAVPVPAAVVAEPVEVELPPLAMPAPTPVPAAAPAVPPIPPMPSATPPAPTANPFGTVQ